MKPNLPAIAAADRAEAVLTAYQNAVSEMDQLVDDLSSSFPVVSDQFQMLLRIGERLSAISVEANAVEDAVLDIAWEVTEAAKPAADDDQDGQREPIEIESLLEMGKL